LQNSWWAYWTSILWLFFDTNFLKSLSKQLKQYYKNLNFNNKNSLVSNSFDFYYCKEIHIQMDTYSNGNSINNGVILLISNIKLCDTIHLNNIYQRNTIYFQLSIILFVYPYIDEILCPFGIFKLFLSLSAFD
jgi:hypothetical protein